MKIRMLALTMTIAGLLTACGGDPACTAAESESCTNQLGVCQARCDPSDADCMQECGDADCICHANYRCPAPGGC
jgi:hypothetical protein